MNRHIVQVVQHLRPGGIECMALDLLAAAGERSVLVSLDGTLEEAVDAWPRIAPFRDRLVFLDKPEGRSPRTVLRLAAMLRRMRPIAVHTHHIGPLLYGGSAARLAGVRTLVHTEHDAWHLEARGRRLLEAALLRLLRPTLVADSPIVAAATRRSVGGYPMRTIDNGVHLDGYGPGCKRSARAVLGLPADAIIVGTAARLEPVKGVDILIDAVRHLTNTHLAIAGDGSERSALRERAEALGIAERVHFLGRVDAMPTFYAALDRFCLSSRHEGLPLSLLEAQACGVPAIVTPVGAMGHAIDPESGIVATAVRDRAVAEALARSLDLEGSPSPREFVAGRFSFERMFASYDALWRGVPA